MKDLKIFTDNIDEVPFVYKMLDEILSCIGDTDEVERIIKPVYNFKENN